LRTKRRPVDIVRKQAEADALILSDFARKTTDAKRRLETFVKSPALTLPAKWALGEAGGLLFVRDLERLPLAFGEFAKQARRAAEIRATAAKAYRPPERGRPRIEEHRKLLFDYLGRVALKHSPDHLAKDPAALEKWLIEAAEACDGGLPEAKWRRRTLTRKRASSPPGKK
jgi:hypothetical protein